MKNEWKIQWNSMIFEWNEKITFFHEIFHSFSRVSASKSRREKLICVQLKKNPLHFPIYPIERSFLSFMCYILYFWGLLTCHVCNSQEKNPSGFVRFSKFCPNLVSIMVKEVLPDDGWPPTSTKASPEPSKVYESNFKIPNFRSGQIAQVGL